MNARATIELPRYVESRKRKNGNRYYFVVPKRHRPAQWPPVGYAVTPDLGQNLDAVRVEAEKLNTALDKMRAGYYDDKPAELGPIRGSIPWLIHERQHGAIYKEKWLALSDIHRRDLLHCWKWWLAHSTVTAARFHKIKVENVKDHHHRSIADPKGPLTRKKILERLAQDDVRTKLNKRRKMASALSRLMIVALDEGIISENPARGLELPVPKTKYYDYTEEEIERAIEAADNLGYPAIGTLLMIMSEAGQREGDAARMRWNRDYRDGHFIFEISKTKKTIKVPATKRLQDRLAAGYDGDNPFGCLVDWPHTLWHLRHVFADKVRPRAQLPFAAKIMHCRHLFARRAVRLNFTAEDVASVTGWSIEAAQQMMDKHYWSPDAVVAENVISIIDQSRESNG